MPNFNRHYKRGGLIDSSKIQTAPPRKGKAGAMLQGVRLTCLALGGSPTAVSSLQFSPLSFTGNAALAAQGATWGCAATGTGCACIPSGTAHRHRTPSEPPHTPRDLVFHGATCYLKIYIFLKTPCIFSPKEFGWMTKENNSKAQYYQHLDRNVKPQWKEGSEVCYVTFKMFITMTYYRAENFV